MKSLKINRAKLDRLAELIIPAMVCATHEQPKIAIQHTASFTVKRSINPFVKERKEKQEEKKKIKEEKRTLEKRAAKTGLLGISTEAEEQIPHMIRFEGEQVNMVSAHINKTNIFEQLIVPSSLVYIAKRFGFVSNIWYISVFMFTTLMFNLVMTIINKRRNRQFEEKVEKFTGMSIESIKDLGEEQVDKKKIKLINRMLLDKVEEDGESYVNYYSLVNYTYNLVEVVKNNLRANYVENYIEQHIMRTMKQERKEEYNRILQHKYYNILKTIVKLPVQILIFAYDHKVFALSLATAYSIYKTIGFINALIYFIQVINTAVNATFATAEVAVNLTTAVSSSVKKATSFIGSLWH